MQEKYKMDMAAIAARAPKEPKAKRDAGKKSSSGNNKAPKDGKKEKAPKSTGDSPKSRPQTGAKTPKSAQKDTVGTCQRFEHTQNLYIAHPGSVGML